MHAHNLQADRLARSYKYRLQNIVFDEHWLDTLSPRVLQVTQSLKSGNFLMDVLSPTKTDLLTPSLIEMPSTPARVRGEDIRLSGLWRANLFFFLQNQKVQLDPKKYRLPCNIQGDSLLPLLS